MGFLLLGVDSLIACIATGAVVTKRVRLPYAVAFGLGDGLGFLLGVWLHFKMPGALATWVETGVLAGLGVYWIVLATVSKRMTGTKWVWVLPWVLSIDNITFGLISHAWSHNVGVQALEQTVSSALLAGIGVAISVAAVRVAPRAIAAMQARCDGGAVGTGGGVVATADGRVAFTGAFGMNASALAGMVAGVALIIAAGVELLVG
jgi:hypothetical protein